MFIGNLLLQVGTVLFLFVLAGSLYWRIGLWSIPRVEQLHTVEGLTLGRRAHELAALSGDTQYHLKFERAWTFLVFGSSDCEPCKSLLRAASQHIATRQMRLIFVADAIDDSIRDCQLNERWESYQFDNEEHARRQWRAPISPYYHVIDPEGRVAAKGTASRSGHLDRILQIGPDHYSDLFVSTQAVPE